MTPEESQLLNDKFAEIEARLHNITIPIAHTDDYEANQIIANTRIQLQRLDHELFNCFHMMDRFLSPVRAKRTPTVDDLEF